MRVGHLEGPVGSLLDQAGRSPSLTVPGIAGTGSARCLCVSAEVRRGARVTGHDIRVLQNVRCSWTQAVPGRVIRLLCPGKA